MNNSIIYYAVKSFIAVDERPEVPNLCKRKRQKNATLPNFFFIRDQISKNIRIMFLYTAE